MWHIDETNTRLDGIDDIGWSTKFDNAILKCLTEIARNLAIVADCLEESNGYDLGFLKNNDTESGLTIERME